MDKDDVIYICVCVYIYKLYGIYNFLILSQLFILDTLAPILDCEHLETGNMSESQFSIQGYTQCSDNVVG